MIPLPAGYCSDCQAPLPGGEGSCPGCGSRRSGRTRDAALRAAVQAALGREYEIRERLARGSRATVFRARQRSLERWVALKVEHAGGDDAAVARARFLHGILVLAHLDHPHVIPLYETPGAGEHCCMVMPLVPESLAAALLSGGRFAPREAARILRETALALAHVHAAGIVHRDVKPQHILLDGPARHVRLIDFGLARVMGPEAHRRATRAELVGTPAYMSPEQAEGRADLGPASDLYALGVVGYQLLTGLVPFEGTAEQQIAAHRTRLPLSPAARHADIPPELAAIVLRCLAKRPERRWSGARELAEALARLGPTSGP